MAPPKKVKLDLKGINDLIFSARMWLESETRFREHQLNTLREQDQLIKQAADKMINSFADAQAKKLDSQLTKDTNGTEPADFKKLFGTP
jgi:hypothetical protein